MKLAALLAVQLVGAVAAVVLAVAEVHVVDALSVGAMLGALGKEKQEVNNNNNVNNNIMLIINKYNVNNNNNDSVLSHTHIHTRSCVHTWQVVAGPAAIISKHCLAKKVDN